MPPPPDPVDAIPPEKREALRVALESLLREGVDLSVRRLRERAKAQLLHAQHVLAAYRNGRFAVDRPVVVPPAPPPAPAKPAAAREDDPGAELAELVVSVDSHERALEATKAVMRALALGRIEPKQSRALLDGLREARQSIKGAAQEGVEEVVNVLPCTAEAAPMLDAFESINDDERRARAMRLVMELAEEDRRARPAVLDTGGVVGEVA